MPELTCGLLSSPVGAVPRDGGDGVVRWVGRRHAGDPARQGRRCNAKVTPELASSGYCPTQHRYDHGVKVHVVGDFQPGTLPSLRFIGLAPSRGYVEGGNRLAQRRVLSLRACNFRRRRAGNHLTISVTGGWRHHGYYGARYNSFMPTLSSHFFGRYGQLPLLAKSPAPAGFDRRLYVGLSLGGKITAAPGSGAAR